MNKYFVNSLGMKMIFVKARPFGAFTPSFADFKKAVNKVSGALERPPVAHRVELPKDYYLAEFPVTNKVYRQFIKETGHREPGGELFDIDGVKTGKVATWLPESEHTTGVVASKIAGFMEDNNAVAGLNYMDAAAFCEWLSKKEDRNYRLPEVYEWEYACRAGADTLFWWGDRPDPRFMNYAASRIGHTTPVGKYLPNPWGFYDMDGNVAECCEQIGRPGGVQKGGAWNYPAGLMGSDVYVDVRGTFKPHMPITRRLMDIGFRIACDASEAVSRASDLKQSTIVAVNSNGIEMPKLEITVGDKIDMGIVPGGSLTFLATKSGKWILTNKCSDDQGRSWRECASVAHNVLQLGDGKIIACNGPGNITAGKGMLDMRISDDDWETVNEFKASVDIPLGVRYWSNPTGMVELDDGSLLLPLYGWMDGDYVRENNPMFPLADEAYKTRVIVVKSTDCGRSWQYLATICYQPEMGREGANETTIHKLPTGDLFVAMRTGLHGYVDKYGREALDEPLLVSWSRCGGKKWAEPTRIYVGDKLVTGIWPKSVVTSDGVVAVLRTRGEPNGSVVFNPDGSGTIWTDEVPYERSGEGSMDSMDLISPHTLLVTYIDSYDWQKSRTSQVIGLSIKVRLK